MLYVAVYQLLYVVAALFFLFFTFFHLFSSVDPDSKSVIFQLPLRDQADQHKQQLRGRSKTFNTDRGACNDQLLFINLKPLSQKEKRNIAATAEKMSGGIQIQYVSQVHLNLLVHLTLLSPQKENAAVRKCFCCSSIQIGVTIRQKAVAAVAQYFGGRVANKPAPRHSHCHHSPVPAAPLFTCTTAKGTPLGTGRKAAALPWGCSPGSLAVWLLRCSVAKWRLSQVGSKSGAPYTTAVNTRFCRDSDRHCFSSRPAS